MASRHGQKKQLRMQQLKENLAIRVSLLDRHVDELISNLRNHHSEVRNRAVQLMSTSGHEPADVQSHQDMMQRVDKSTQAIENLNSAFFDQFDSDDSDGEEGAEAAPQGMASRQVHQQQDMYPNHAPNNDVRPRSLNSQQVLPDGGAVRNTSPASERTGGNPVMTTVQLPSSGMAPLQNVASASAVAPATSAAATLSAATAPSFELYPTVGIATNASYMAQQPHVASTSTEAVTATVDCLGAQSATGFDSHMFAPPQAVSAAVTALSRAAPCFGVQPQFVVPHMLAQPSEMPQALAGGLVSSTVGAGQELPLAASSVPTEVKERELKQDQLPSDSAITVTMSFCNNPWSFFLIKCSSTLRQLAKQICYYVQQTRHVQQTVEVGTLCLAQFTDGVYYRARVTDLHREAKVTVYFVDYGNFHITESSELLTLPDQLRQLPALAVHCCLSGVAPTSKTDAWTEESVNKFSGLVNGHDMICRAKTQSPDSPSFPTLIELLKPTAVPRMTSDAKQRATNISNINVAHILFSRRLARPIDNEELLVRLAKGGYRAPVIHTEVFNTPSDQTTSVAPSEADTVTKLKVTTCAEHSEESDTGDLLPAAQLQDILRRIPKIPQKLAKTRKKSAERRAGRSISPKSIPEETVEQRDTEPEIQADIDSLGDNASMYKNLMQGISDSGDFELLRAMASAVNSPTDFYIHIVSAETGKLLKNMMEDLNRIFERTPRATLRFRSRRFDPRPGVLCCTQWKDNNYYRGLVIDVRASSDPSTKEKGVQVFFVDFGEKEWLSSFCVYPLPSDFHHIAPLAVWCSLAYVRPLPEPDVDRSDREDSVMTWQPEALAEFEQLVGKDEDKLLYVLTPKQLSQGKRADAIQREPQQVILIDAQDSSLCINHDLIVRNFAGPAIHSSMTDDGDSGTVEDVPVDVEDVEGWNDMERDASSLRNAYQVDVNDAGVALTGVKARGGNYGVCRFYNTPSSCWKGEKCPYLHVEPGMEKGVSGNLKKVAVFDEDQSAVLPAEGAVVTVEISCVKNPNHFYIVLPWGPHAIQEVTNNSQGVMEFLVQESLESLNAAMAKFYKDKGLDSDYSLYAPGEAVAAKSQTWGKWLRAKVIDINPDSETVLVMFVDFGDMEWVSELNLRQLDDQFLPLPPQAVECCLTRVLPPPPQTSWPDSSRTEFFDLVDGKTLVAHVKQRMWSGRLSIELYNTSQETEDINIGTVLIQRGLAVAAEDNNITAEDQQRMDRPDPEADGTIYVPG